MTDVDDELSYISSFDRNRARVARYSRLTKKQLAARLAALEELLANDRDADGYTPFGPVFSFGPMVTQVLPTVLLAMVRDGLHLPNRGLRYWPHEVVGADGTEKWEDGVTVYVDGGPDDLARWAGPLGLGEPVSSIGPSVEYGDGSRTQEFRKLTAHGRVGEIAVEAWTSAGYIADGGEAT
ncbi:hypothetical protein [Cryptosporangium sp. NPDC051539]|uniref:hypothetical protein n=1 Tax=Cryptosporangium sp. NPDC051539 TaxID=3363962 RepID=UPI0037A02330